MRILILKMTLSDGQVVFLPSFVREDEEKKKKTSAPNKLTKNELR